MIWVRYSDGTLFRRSTNPNAKPNPNPTNPKTNTTNPGPTNVNPKPNHTNPNPNSNIPFTRYNRLSNRLDNRLYRVNGA